MKDIRIFSADTEIGRLRVDSISGDSNLTVMETYGLDDRSPDIPLDDPDFADKVSLAEEFKKVETSFNSVQEFVVDNLLAFKVEESDGKGIVLSGTLTDGSNTVAYSQTLTVTGGSGNNSFSVLSGSLPSGLTLNSSTGVVSGTPDTVETQTFVIKCVDTTNNYVDSKEFTVEITE